MNPKLTIITPTYNHEKFIVQCLNSVRKQTYQDWEQIIIDDASSDKTPEIVSSFAKLDKRIKVIRHKNNWGIGRLTNTYNQALKMAKGEFIAILEGDDFWPRDKLEKQIESFPKKDAVFSFGDCIMTNEKGLPIKLFRYNHDKRLLENRPVGAILTLFANLNFSVIPVTVIIKRDILISIGGFHKNRHYPFLDIPTFLEVALKGRFFYHDDVLGFYRKQSNSEWFRFAKETSAMGRKEIQQCVNSFLEKHKTDPNVNEVYKKRIVLFKRQEIFIKRKQSLKIISLLLNFLAFKTIFSPLTLIFAFEFAHYKLRRLFK